MSDNDYQLIKADCLESLKKMPEESVDLIYLDPPFLTQRTHQLSSKNGKEYSFDDSWSNSEEYVAFMKDRLAQMHRVLKSTGSIFLHCDTSAVHLLRMSLDQVFGASNFRSEIIWTYKRWSNAKKGLLNAHQTILFYSKTKDFKFNKQYVEYSPTTNLDQILQERVRDSRNKTVYKTDSNGDIVNSKEKKGVPLSDVWEIPFLNPKAKERTGYPTQKPIALLLRILEIASDPGDLILDPFCGSGTTLVASKLCARKAIGIDVNNDAIELAESRLEKPVYSESALMKNGANSYKTKDSITMAILEELGCKTVQRNKGIDGFLTTSEGRLAAVKIQKASETIHESARLLCLAADKKNCDYKVLVQTKNEQSLFDNPVTKEVIVIDSYRLALSSYFVID